MTAIIKNKYKSENVRAWLLIALGCIVYFSSYVMRYSYTVSMAKIIEVTSLTKSQAGVVGTALFFSYGIGQIVSGFLGDKLKPGAIIFAGAIAGSVCNFIFPLCASVTYYVAVWAVNGFAQAMLWPPLVRIFSDRLSPEKCTTAIVLVTISANLASVALYLVIPQIIKALSWESVFFVCGLFSAASAVVWAAGYATIIMKNPDKAESRSESAEVKPVVKNSEKVGLFPILAGSGVIFTLIGIIAQGFLRDGITTWFPSYVSQTFALPAENSILITAALSAAAIAGVYFTKWIFRRFFRNEVNVSIVFFAAISVLSLVLFAFYSSGIALSVICSALSVALAHGINLMLIAYIPPRFSRFNKTSTVSGITNACTYIGSALSAYLFALVAEYIGWRFVILCWAVIAAIGCVFCVLAYNPWKNFLIVSEKPAIENKNALLSEVNGIRTEDGHVSMGEENPSNNSESAYNGNESTFSQNDNNRTDDSRKPDSD